MVITDGGSVYTQPDFDAQVAEYLTFKTQIWVSPNAVPGHGGLGLFHHVRYQGKTGFMADTDIHVLEKEAEIAAPEEDKSAVKKPKKPKSKAFEAETEENFRKSEPIFFTRYIGAAGGIVNYTEKFSGNNLADHMPMVGLRMTGPGVLFDGPPMDINILYSWQHPAYYKSFGANVTGNALTNYLLFGDFTLLLPLVDEHDWVINYGIGVMWAFAKYNVNIVGSTFDSQELRVGLDFALGAAYRFGFGPKKHKPYAVRLDGKYYFEQTQYIGFLGSLQTEF
jgi:hypothetical protein